MARAADRNSLLQWRPRRRVWAALAMCFVGWGTWSAVDGWRADHAFLINTTDSLPNWAFIIHRNRQPARGDYIFFDPPRNALVRRHFGAKPKLFGKIVYGIAGDTVGHDGSRVTINGRPVARMKRRSRLGETLTPGTVGRVPNGCYFAGTPHKDGFDSRYAEIGFVCTNQIIGTGEAVL